MKASVGGAISLHKNSGLLPLILTMQYFDECLGSI